jgi:hypothetical protein
MQHLDLTDEEAALMASTDNVAKVERLGRRPRFSISARMMFSSSSSGVSASCSSASASWREPDASTALRLFVLSPDCEECASSTMTAKRLPGSSPAYCLHVTLGRRLHALAPGLTPRSAIEKFAAVQDD